MRLPTRFLGDHLTFTYDGTVWATWEVFPPTYEHLAARAVVSWLSATAKALSCLPGDVLLSGVCKPVPAATVAAAMRSGVTNPYWLEMVEMYEGRLQSAEMYERRVYISAALPRGRRSRAELAVGSAVARLARRFRLPPLPVPAREYDACLAQADHLEALLRGHLGADRIAPVRNGTLKWLYARAGRRGTLVEPREERFRDSRLTTGGERDLLMRGPSLANLRPPHLYEGGTKDDPDRPRHRSYLRADTEVDTCYQSIGVLADLPQEWTVPGAGGEKLALIDQVGFPMDWAVLLRPRNNADALRDIRAKRRKLHGQYEEHAGDLSGIPGSLPAAVEQLDEEEAALRNSPGSPEYRTTFMFGVGASSLIQLEERFDLLRGILNADEYTLERPTGDQRALWLAMLPGATPPPVVNDYTEYLLAETVAGCAPFTGSGLGDPEGGLFATSLDARMGGVVLLSPAYGPSMPKNQGGPRSGNIGICGQLGSGKSQTGKKLIHETLARDGQVVAVDRTNFDGVGEYGKLIPHLPPRTTHQVVRVGRDAVVLDPIRMFKGNDADRYTTGFLTILTGTTTRSARGALLGEAVTHVREAGGCLEDVVVYLEEHDHPEADVVDARELARLIRQCTRSNAMARVAFGKGDPVELTADFILFHAPELALPNEEELLRPDDLLPDQVFSVALLYLINCVARSVAFQDRDRFTLIVVDEGYALKASPQGRSLLLEIAKDGRKHNAALLFITHLPSEIPPEVSDTLGTRMLFRCSRERAPECLRWMHMEPSPRNVDLIAEDSGRQAGECLLLDRWGRHGLCKVRQPHTQALRDAFDTSVGQKVAAVPPSDEVAATTRQRGELLVTSRNRQRVHLADDDLAPEVREPASVGTNGNGHRPPAVRRRARVDE